MTTSLQRRVKRCRCVTRKLLNFSPPVVASPHSTRSRSISQIRDLLRAPWSAKTKALTTCSLSRGCSLRNLAQSKRRNNPLLQQRLLRQNIRLNSRRWPRQDTRLRVRLVLFHPSKMRQLRAPHLSSVVRLAIARHLTAEFSATASAFPKT